MRNANADSKIEFPFRRDIEINRREEILLLFYKWIEAGEIAVIAVVFKPGSDLLRNVIRDLEVRRELDAFAHTWPVPGAVKRWIE